MRPQQPPTPEYAFGYRRPPRSGNEINGLGVADKVRATPVFHRHGEATDWQALDDFFSFINPWSVVVNMVRNTWQLRRSDGPVAGTRREVDDAAAMAAEVKGIARQAGAALVGITRITEEDLYVGREMSYEYAVCIGLDMVYEEMAFAPQKRAAVEVMRAYREISKTAIRVAEAIRAMGWPAKAYGNPNVTDILHIPLAQRAGLGQLGKHGSMISKEHGSNFRLAAVLTNLPMALDEPVDIGVDDLCASCTRCVIDCPADAIVNEKRMVRGEHKWYVDFDKCVPYFVKTYGCAICIEVCPWSEPGHGPDLMEHLLRKRAQRRTA